MLARSVDDVAETLRMARHRGKACSVLIGAGCSISAGVPGAVAIVEEIANAYPRAYERAPIKSYPGCMAELSPGERRDLIATYVDSARVNWAHLCIAQLMKSGYVDRVLTTNFDPLIVRACALLGEFPAIYDFATSQQFKPADIPDRAVFYLHGQRSGFVLLNTEDEVRRYSDALKPVFDDAGRGRVWLVVGYSGDNDPVFTHLASVPHFDNSLYWVGYHDEPSAHVRTELLDMEKDAFYVAGQGADEFFIRLLRRLDCFPPQFIADPLGYLEALLDTLIPFEPPGGEGTVDVTQRARAVISRARGEKVEDREADRLQNLFMAGDYDQLLQETAEIGPDAPDSLRDASAWSLVMKANELGDAAGRLDTDDASAAFERALELYERAVNLVPGMGMAYHNWGVALEHFASSLSDPERQRELLEAALGRFEIAAEKGPIDGALLSNWAVTMGRLGLLAADRAEALAHLRKARSLYKQATDLDPDRVPTLNNWAVALLSEYRVTDSEAERAELLSEAQGVLARVEELSPGRGSYNLACLAGLRQDIEEARKWLTVAEAVGSLPDAEHLRTDIDLDVLRDQEWFAELLARTEQRSNS
jgi:tetratricopeptide (TPR) repeat protein